MDASQLINYEPNPNLPDFGPGDSVRVNFRIREGDRERVQAFRVLSLDGVMERGLPQISPLGV